MNFLNKSTLSGRVLEDGKYFYRRISGKISSVTLILFDLHVFVSSWAIHVHDTWHFFDWQPSNLACPTCVEDEVLHVLDPNSSLLMSDRHARLLSLAHSHPKQVLAVLESQMEFDTGLKISLSFVNCKLAFKCFNICIKLCKFPCLLWIVKTCIQIWQCNFKQFFTRKVISFPKNQMKCAIYWELFWVMSIWKNHIQG